MKSKIHHIFILLLLLSTCLVTNAQVRQEILMERRQMAGERRPVKLKEVKKNYIAKRLELSPEQSIRFLPVYEQYQSEYEGILKARRANNTTAEPGADQFERDIGYQQKITALQKHYYEEFSKIMSPEKASQVFKSEKDFNIELVRRLKEGGRNVTNPPVQQQPSSGN